MGRRGPPKTPTKILELRGSWRSKTRPHEPKVPLDKPTCPAWLSQEAKAVWRALIPQLYAVGCCTKLDQFPLARYCSMYVQWRRAEAFITQHGPTYPLTNSQGDIVAVKTFPQTRILLRLSTELLRLENEFGMTPASRASLGQVPMPPRQAHDVLSDHNARYFRQGS